MSIAAPSQSTSTSAYPVASPAHPCPCIVMPRGEAEYILSDKLTVELCQRNSLHPRIARSEAAKLAIAEILHRFSPPPDSHRITPDAPPPFMKELTFRYNSTFLDSPNALKLECRNLWRIFFRRQYGQLHCLPPKNLSLTHHAIYIQQRHNGPDEPVVGLQKRKKAATTNPIGPDHKTITNVTTIDQSGSPSIQYISKNLHSRHHGSIDKSDIRNLDGLYHSLGIRHKILSLKSAGTRGVSADGDVVVAFHTAAHF